MENKGSDQKKDLAGYLYPNKKSSDKQPDWRGKATIAGKEWLVSGWTRQDKDGMISIQFTDPSSLPAKPQQGKADTQQASAPKQEQKSQPQQQAAAPTTGQVNSNPDPMLDELEDLFKKFP